MQISFYGNNRPTARYATASTVREEALHGTRLVGLYWSASGQVQRENVAAMLPFADPIAAPLHVFELEIDGQLLHNCWNWVAATERGGRGGGTREAVVELAHQVRPVTVKVVTRLDDTPFLARYLEVTNTGGRPAALAHVSPWCGMLWQNDEHVLPPGVASPFTLGYFDSIAWGSEGNFTWAPLSRGVQRLDTTFGRSGWGNPFFIVRNELTGEAAIGGLAWSGNWFLEFRYDPQVDMENRPASGFNLSFRTGPAGPPPLRMIAPGETITTPEVHLGLVHLGLDECVAAWHAHMRASVIPPRPTGKEFYSIAARVVEEPGDWILKEIDIAAEMGVDSFGVDAGWYGGTFGSWWEQRGDWTEGGWIPGGLAACRERCRRHGMMFGLWIEPESAGPKARILKDHPDWLLRTDNGRDIDCGGGRALDLANPDAARFFTDTILRVARDYEVDFLKLDYNITVNEGGQRLRDGFIEHESWRHCEVLYEAFDRLRRELPHVALENCAGGGGRNDLGLMARFHYMCESDASQFPRSIRAINGLTMMIPPESLCYYHNHIHTAHQKAGLDTHLRAALFAQPIFVGFGAHNADRATPYFEKTRHYIRLIKEFTGPILAGHPDVFHHTPAIGLHAPAEWCVLEYAARDRSAGFCGAFRLGAAADSHEYVLKPRGAAVDGRYLVTLHNSGQTLELAGVELAQRGLPVRLDQPNTSELVLYRTK